MFLGMIRSENFPQLVNRLSLHTSDFSNLLYACAHVELLDKNYEWPILMEAFSNKVLN